MHYDTSPQSFSEHTADSGPVYITQPDFEALGDSEPGTEAAHRLLGSMGLIGGGLEKVVIVDPETGDPLKSGYVNTTPEDLGTFKRHTPEEEANSTQTVELDDDVDLLAQGIDRIQLSELLEKALSTITSSAENDAALTRKLGGAITDELMALKSQLMRADSEGPWQGNRLRNHSMLKRRIEDFTSDALRVLPIDDNRAPDSEVKQTKLVKRELDEACDALASIAGQDERARPAVAQLRELAYNYGNAAGMQIDASVLRRILLNLRNASDDSQITVSDVIGSVGSISRAIEECVAKGRSANMRKMQLANDLHSFDIRLRHK